MSDLNLSPDEMDPKVFPLAVAMWHRSTTNLALAARQVQEDAAEGKYDDAESLVAAVVSQIAGDLWSALIGLAAQVDVLNGEIHPEKN